MDIVHGQRHHHRSAAPRELSTPPLRSAIPSGPERSETQTQPPTRAFGPHTTAIRPPYLAPDFSPRSGLIHTAAKWSPCFVSALPICVVLVAASRTDVYLVLTALWPPSSRSDTTSVVFLCWLISLAVLS
ncbi:hypothetical protein BJ138DRAFT_1130942 [Hygrophoropsis aurantiaca]|uniref:Uncharacterized protein n=1 Tax=Hygrophoropsis aurantiaca TaxID=72124 RepID=A0ACB7ZTP9_9AGAM|nr:hypothetical protein BJ138DRAFT_1130942 [Hygrophoropsis aurantiaca]